MIDIKIYNESRTSHTVQSVPLADSVEFTNNLDLKGIWWTL